MNINNNNRNMHRENIKGGFNAKRNKKSKKKDR